MKVQYDIKYSRTQTYTHTIYTQQRVCNTDWDALVNGAYPAMRHQTWQNYCFSAVFLSVLLEEGMSMPPEMNTKVCTSQHIPVCIAVVSGYAHFNAPNTFAYTGSGPN